jgi:hypothetical protein
MASNKIIARRLTFYKKPKINGTGFLGLVPLFLIYNFRGSANTENWGWHPTA